MVYSASTSSLDPVADPAAQAEREPIEGEINDGNRIKRQELADGESADDRDAERMAQFRSDAGSQREWNAAKHRGHRGHHDGTERNRHAS